MTSDRETELLNMWPIAGLLGVGSERSLDELLQWCPQQRGETSRIVMSVSGRSPRSICETQLTDLWISRAKRSRDQFFSLR